MKRLRLPDPIEECVSSDASPWSAKRTFEDDGQYDPRIPDQKLMYDTHNLYGMLDSLHEAERLGHTQVCVRAQSGFEQWIPLRDAIEITQNNLDRVKAEYFN